MYGYCTVRCQPGGEGFACFTGTLVDISNNRDLTRLRAALFRQQSVSHQTLALVMSEIGDQLTTARCQPTQFYLPVTMRLG